MSRPVALITGASRGIGAAAAIALAERGYDLALTARTLEEGEMHDYGSFASDTRALPGSLRSVAARCESLGAQVLCQRADILLPATIEAVADEALAHFGRVDLLFNNACFQGPGNMMKVLDITAEQMRDIYQGNVLTPLRLVQKVLPAMLAQGSGRVINMVSGSALIDPPAPADKGGWGFAYSSSKAALIRMAGVLRAEHRDAGVAFFNVEPGFVITEVMRANGIDSATAEHFQATDAVDVGRVIAWLAQEEAALDWQERSVIHAPALVKRLPAKA